MPELLRPHPHVAAIVVAAGSGRRMAAGENKLFLALDQRPILAHTVEALARTGRFDVLVLVIREDERARVDAILAAIEAPLPEIRFAIGGAERADSVSSGVAAAGDADVVMIHDGARPFVSRALVERLVDAVDRLGAAIPALPVADTLKRVEGERIVATVDRRGLYRAQTPQAFRRELLQAAMIERDGAGDAPTDDAAILEAAGRAVAIVDGDAMNLKITTPDDLRLARLYLAAFEREEDHGGAR